MVEDALFLQRILAVAADWRPGAHVRPVEELMAEPLIAHYIAGWPKDGDVGFVAEDRGPLGAAWWRFFRREAPGYGFVDEAIPEISIGVTEKARRRGVGTSLIEALIAEAGRSGLAALSLSVEMDNAAALLYERLGFRAVGRSGDSLTMVLHLTASS